MYTIFVYVFRGVMAADLLTVKEIENAKPAEKQWTLKDGDGLFVLVHPNGSKYFQQRARLHGKEKLVRLGVFPVMTLAMARARALEIRRMVADGIDPIQNKRIEAAKKAASASSTFRSVAEQWLAIKQRTLAPSSYKKIVQTFNANIYPRFGSFPIKEVNAQTVRTAMQVMESRGALELMEKCRAWVRDVFEFALGEGLLQHNPIPQKDLVLKKHRSTSHPRLKNREDAGRFLRNLFEYQGRNETRLAIWLLMLIATRPGELRLAEWTEFDLEKGLWTVPLDRMKTRMHMTEPHVVTLSRQAIDALKELQVYSGHSRLLFPSLTNSGKPMSDMTLAQAVKAIWPDYRIVPHGFRHFFSTMANEHGHFRPDVIEAALAHKDDNAIRAVYNRAIYLKERRELAQWWADELDAMRTNHMGKQ